MSDLDPNAGPSQSGSCRKCGDSLEVAQTYCLSCGHRAAGPRVPSGPVLEAIAIASLAAYANGGKPPEPVAEPALEADAADASSAAVPAAAGIGTLFASKSAGSTGLALLIVGMIAGAAFSPPAPNALAGRRVVIVQGANTPATGPAAEPSADPGTGALVADTGLVDNSGGLGPAPTPTPPPDPPAVPADPAIGHIALVLLPGGGVGQSINPAASAALARRAAKSADTPDWSSAFADLKKKGFLLKGFKQNYNSGFANRMAFLSGAAPTPEMLATDDSAAPRGNKNEGEWSAKTYPKGVMVSHAGKWYLAKLTAKAGDEPGPADSTIWEEQKTDSSTEWSATATDSTITPGSYAKDYVVSTMVGTTKKLWKAKADTTPTDIPSDGADSKWESLAGESYTGPQPVRDVGCAGPVPAVSGSSGCLIPSEQDDLITLVGQSVASDRGLRVYIDTVGDPGKKPATFCRPAYRGEVVHHPGVDDISPLDDPVLWFRKLTGDSQLFKAKSQLGSLDLPGVAPDWETIQAWKYTGPQPVDSNKGDWSASNPYKTGDLVRHDQGRWWQATRDLEAGTPDAEPGADATSDSPAWAERGDDTAMVWSATSVEADPKNPGFYPLDSVVSTLEDGHRAYWRAMAGTFKEDVPGSSNKWARIGTAVYSGPQPSESIHDKKDWSQTKAYEKSDIVRSRDGNWYVAKESINPSSDPPSPSSAAWELRTKASSVVWDPEQNSYPAGSVVERIVDNNALCHSASRPGSIRPLSEMGKDLKDAAKKDSTNIDELGSFFPKVTLIIPSRCRIDAGMKCSDGSVGGPTTLAKFLKDSVLTGLVDKAPFKQDGFALVAWDRPAAGTSTPGGALVLSDLTSTGRSNKTPYDILSLTRTIEDRFGLAGGAGMPPYLGISDKSTPLGLDVFPRR